MRSNLIRAAAGTVVLALAVIAACPARQADGQGWTGNAKDFRFSTIDGQQHRLSDYAGKPLVVNFFSTT